MKKFIFSLKCATRGLYTVFKEERNFKIQIFFAILAIILGILLNLTKIEFLFIILSITGVLGVEIINTAIEDLCNKVEPHHDETIGKIKDIMAGLVIVSAIFASITGLWIFLPKIF